jgi:hypothetical protein
MKPRRQPDLLMGTRWPDEDTRHMSAAALVADEWLDLYWPVRALPAAMGLIPTAQLIPGDPEGCYYARMRVGFIPMR